MLHILHAMLRELIFLFGLSFAIFGFMWIIPRIRQEAWSFVAGVASTVIGLVCYALSSSFNDLFGNWNWWKIMLYIIFSFTVLLLVCSTNAWRSLSFLQHKAHVMFLVIGSTTIYSFFSDRASKGKPDAYNVVSYAAFAIMSFSFGFVELVYFFSAVVTSQLMKIDLLLGFVGMSFSYFLIIFPESRLEEVEASYIVISQWRKQRVWKLVIVASTEIALVCLALGCYFNLLSGETSSLLKILFWIVSFVCSFGYSYAVLVKLTGQHLIVPRFHFHTTVLMSALAVTSAYCTFFPDSLAARGRVKQEAYRFAFYTAIFVAILGFPKPQRRFTILYFFISFQFLGVLTMYTNMWLCFVEIGLSFLPFILRLYLDATPHQLGLQVEPQLVVVEQASPQSNTQDQSQVITEAASPPTHSDNEDQPPRVLVIEVENSPQEVSSGELASPQASDEHQPQEDSPQVVSSDGVDSPQLSDEDHPQIVMDETSLQSTATA